MYKCLITAILGVVFLGAAFTANEEVTSTKLNTLNNANIDSSAGIDPEKVDDHSTSASEQDETADPYTGDAQTLAANARDEIKQLRFQLAQIIQGNSNAAASQKWYNDPGNYLALPASGTQGDVWFYDRGADVKRLAAGTDGQFLKSQGANSDLVWGTAVAMPASTTQGDVFYINVSNAFARLGAGTSGQALKTFGVNNNPGWSDFIASPASTTQGDILYRDASASTWVRLAASTSGNALTTQGSNNNPKWASSSGGFSSRCAAKRTTTQAITSATFTKVQLNAEDYDNDNEFDSTTNYRFTVTTAGGYLINANIEFTTAGVGYYEVIIYKNGSIVSPGGFHEGGEWGGATARAASHSIELTLAANDYIELFIWHDTGGTPNLTTAYMSVSRRW